MTERLKALEEEYRRGQRMLFELDEKRAETRDTLLRISGAIQVLRELAALPDAGAEAVAAAGE